MLSNKRCMYLSLPATLSSEPLLTIFVILEGKEQLISLGIDKYNQIPNAGLPPLVITGHRHNKNPTYNKNRAATSVSEPVPLILTLTTTSPSTSSTNNNNNNNKKPDPYSQWLPLHHSGISPPRTVREP